MTIGVQLLIFSLAFVLICYLPNGISLTTRAHRIVGYIGGFGSGKSFALAAKAITLGLLNPGTTAMVAEPSFPMIRTVFIPAMDLALEQWGIDYDFRVSPQPEYTLKLPTGNVKLLSPIS